MNRRTRNNQEKYHITRHFVVSFVLIALLLVVIPLITVFLLTKAYDDQIRNETNQTSTSIRQMVRTFVEGAYNLSNEIAASPSILAMDVSIQAQMLADTMARNDYMELLYITNMDGMQVARSEGPLGDRSGRWWFLQITENEQPFVSKSYYSISTGMPCTAVFIPMYDKDEMIGVLGVDISLEYIQQLTEQFTRHDSGRCSFIIDGEGVVIAHPDSSLLKTLTNYKMMIRNIPATDELGNQVFNPDGSIVTKEEEFTISDEYQTIISSVMAGNSGQEIIEEGDSAYYISYEPIIMPGYSDSWSVITLQERSVAMGVISQLVARLLLIILLILAVFIVLIIGFFKSLRKTLNSLENVRDEADKRTRIILNASPRINILFDSDWNLIDCNPAAVQFMGFETKEEMLAGFIERMTKGMPEIQSDGRVSMPITDWLMATAKEGNVKFETELYIDDTLKILDVNFKRVPYEDSFAIVGYVVDMTDIRERERELLSAHEENEIQLTKLKLVLKATKIVLWDMEIQPGDTDPVNDARPFMWSDEFRHLLGFNDENDFPNLTGSFSNRVHPDDKEINIGVFMKHIHDKTGKTPYDIEIRVMKKSGEYAYYRVSGETIRDTGGNPIRVAGALMDISETKNLIQENETQRIVAENANKAKSAFLSTMSHEIRTPMNAILGITEIQLQNESLDQSAKEAFDKIYTSGDLLLSIINDILDLSKIEAGKLELIIERYEIASMISDAAQLNMMRTSSKPIGFELHVDEQTPAYLLGDELRIKEILSNVLSNAFKYTTEGMVKLLVATEACDGNDDEVILVIKVSDTGQGMTEVQISNLFDEYARFNMETNRTTEGTGLGMSITRNLIRLMKGEITVESEPGKGSVFTIYLPQGRAGSEVLGKEGAESLNKFRTSNRGYMRRAQITRELMPYGSVLIVDDVETNVYVAKGLMSPYKLKIDSADSGFAAIEKIKNGAIYDIVFMDHMMPKMDGIEAVGIIRNMGYNRTIIALTANAVSGQAEKFRENGFDDFISKPIDIRQLNSILNKFIRDKQLPEVIEAARKKRNDMDEEVHKMVQKNEIAGLDIAKGLKRFNSDEVSYMKVLHSYADSVRSMLDEIEDVKEDNLVDYRIIVHGIKGTSYTIFADQIGKTAEGLEKAAKAGDFSYIEMHNQLFIESTRKFIAELDVFLSTMNSENVKPKKDKPDDEVLSKLLAACRSYDMDGVDAAIAEIGKYQYESDNGLVEWLLENVETLSFEEIARKLDKQ